MILPQHLEPFLLRENPALNCALKAADQEYNSLTDEEEGRVANVLLSIIARGTCRSYCDNILTICELKPSACRQLANDIGTSIFLLWNFFIHLLICRLLGKYLR